MDTFEHPDESTNSQMTMIHIESHRRAPSLSMSCEKNNNLCLWVCLVRKTTIFCGKTKDNNTLPKVINFETSKDARCLHKIENNNNNLSALSMERQKKTTHCIKWSALKLLSLKMLDASTKMRTTTTIFLHCCKHNTFGLGKS